MQLEKNAFLVRDKIRFFADIFITGNARKWLPQTLSNDNYSNSCALLKPVEKTFEDLIRKCQVSFFVRPCTYTLTNLTLTKTLQHKRTAPYPE